MILLLDLAQCKAPDGIFRRLQVISELTLESRDVLPDTLLVSLSTHESTALPREHRQPWTRFRAYKGA